MSSNPFTSIFNAGNNGQTSLFGNGTTSIFGNNSSNNIFGFNNSNNLFSNTKNQKKDENNLNFGNNLLFNNNNDENNKGEQNNSPSLFGNNPFTNNKNDGNAKGEQNNSPSLFGNSPFTNNNDGNTKGEQNNSPSLFGNNPFTNNNNGLFGSNNKDNTLFFGNDKKDSEAQRNENKNDDNKGSGQFNLFSNVKNSSNPFFNKNLESNQQPQGFPFGKDNNNNNIETENKTLDKNEKNESNSIFQNNNNEHNKLDFKLFTNNGEKDKNEDTNKNNINENSSYNPFNSNQENSKIQYSLNNNNIPNEKEEILNTDNKKSKSIFETNNPNEDDKEHSSLLKNKENQNSIFTSQDNKNNNIISNNISLFGSNDMGKSLFGNNDKNQDNKEEEEEINNSNDMDVEMEKKDESSSTNSDYIKNLWISDTEEIIDDDIDVNKKINYKNIEEKSKNIPNNINDINSLIIPELSEFYFNLMKSSDNNINYNSNIKNSIDLSKKIISILKDKIELYGENKEKKNELINLTTIFTYFDAFFLHRNDIIYLMKLRDDIFYKYFMNIETAININKNSNSNDSIINNLENIYFHLSLFDISKAKQKISQLIRIYKGFIQTKKFDNQTLVFKDLFINIEKIIKIYNDIYNLKGNFNSKQIISSFNMNPIFQEVKEIIFELRKDCSNNKEDEKSKILASCQKICGIFTGDINYIINDFNKENIHSIILGNIFYRFYLNDFIKELQNCLNIFKNSYNKDNNLVNNIIVQIVKSCDSNQIELVQELKGKYPFILRYHMIEILGQNNFLYQIENQEKYLKSESYLLFQMLKDSKINFKYYLNYFLFYPYYEIFAFESGNEINNLPDEPSDEIREKGYRKALDYALIYISYRFNNYENIQELIDEINEIKNEIREKIKNNYAFDIIYKINKLCLNKFIEKKIYKYAIDYYIDNYKLENEDFEKLQIREMRKQLCAENDLNYDYSEQFDKIIINFYLETSYLFNIQSFREIYETNKNKITNEFNEYQELLKFILYKKNNSPIDSKILFMINYISFLNDVISFNLNIIENNNNHINIVAITKKFFENCFPLPKCPSFIWYHILMILKQVIDDNISFFNNDTFLDFEDNICEQLFIWDKKLIYELTKIEKIKKNNISFDEAQKMYENATTFLNDVIQGVYFTQNIFSISNKYYY